MRRSRGTISTARCRCRKPGSLTHDEVYALVAFLLYRNGIIQETDVMDAKSLPKVEMPNRNGFVPAVPVYPPEPRNPAWW